MAPLVGADIVANLRSSILHSGRFVPEVTRYIFSVTTTMSSEVIARRLSRRTESMVAYSNATGLDFSKGLDGVDLGRDKQLTAILMFSMVTVCAFVVLSRVWHLLAAHIRLVNSLHSVAAEQSYWTFDKSWFHSWFKKEIVYAPLGDKRHNREVQIGKASNYGTIPGRAHFILLMLYLIGNLIFCVVLDYNLHTRMETIAQLRGRTGILATVNMVPLVLLAGRNNPLITMMKISFDTFNLFHRWIGRMVVLESIVHVCAWYANKSVAMKGRSVWQSFHGDTFLTVGLVATIAMCILLLQSLSPLRHAFYETFLHIHQILAFIAIGAVYVHLETQDLPALKYMPLIVMAWLLERTLRVARVLYLNLGFRRRTVTQVIIEALPGDACRITFKLPRPTTIRPGSHVYVYLPKYSWWMSHPFSVAWTNVETAPPTGPIDLELELDSDKTSLLGGRSGSTASNKNSELSHLRMLSLASPNYLERQAPKLSKRWGYSKPPTSLALITAARTGMTRQIYEAACKAPNRTLMTTGFVEGPYAGHDDLSSYGTVIMFAGGAGITHHLVQIRHLLASRAANTVATRKIVLAWTVRDRDALSWVAPWMDEILRMPGRKQMLEVRLFVTRPRGAIDTESPSRSIILKNERCDPGKILDRVMMVKGGRCGAVFVSVCGPGAFADEVRKAVRDRVWLGGVDMNEEAFTW